jgi:isopenicillin-N epimerase
MKDEENPSDSIAPDYRQFWQLDPAITFLNHGSFGACPIAVLEKQREWRDRLEREPVRFFEQAIEPLLDQARQRVADFVGAEAENLALILALRCSLMGHMHLKWCR